MTVTQAPIGIIHYVEEAVYKAQKAMVAAQFHGLKLTPQKFDIAKEGKKPAFLEMNPMSKVPFLQTDTGCIASSNAIARYVARCRADTSLYGKCFDDEGQIDTWMEFSTYDLEVPLAVWLYPVLGLMEAPKLEVTENAKSDVKKSLQVLEDRLKVSAFLVGDFVSLADIVVVCVLKEAFVRVFDPAFRKPFVKVCAWFELCCKMPQFKSVLGEVSLCKQAEKPIPVKYAAVAPSKAAEKKAEPKKEAKKEAQKAEPKAKAEPTPKAQAKAETKPAAAAATGLTPELEAKIKAVGDEIRVVKEKLKGQGITGQKLNNHEEIKSLVEKLNALKAEAPSGGAPAAAPPVAPAAAPAPAPASGGGSIDAQVKDVGDQIRVLKEKLKGEGLSGKKINEHPEVKSLVAKLTELKAQL
jgi:elongation factor 1-gamma